MTRPTRVIHQRVVAHSRDFAAAGLRYRLTLACGHVVEHDGLEPMPELIRCAQCEKRQSGVRIQTIPPRRKP